MTCKRLSLRGYTPVVIDNLSRGFERLVKWGPFYKSEFDSIETLEKISNEYDMSGVIHFAAYAYVGESVEKPELYMENNYHKTKKLIENLERLQLLNNFIFSSSCATYGQPSSIPITENCEQDPLSPYGLSKLKVEKFLNSTTLNFNKGILRYFNACGADPDGETGECHEPETHLIPLAIKAAFDSNYTLKVFGNDYETKDGSCIRDYIHVQDLADYHVDIFEYILKNNCDVVYNLGQGKGYSVFEIIQTIEKISGKKVKYKTMERRDGDPARLYADNSKIKKDLGNRGLMNIDQIISDAINWYKSNS